MKGKLMATEGETLRELRNGMKGLRILLYSLRYIPNCGVNFRKNIIDNELMLTSFRIMLLHSKTSIQEVNLVH
jgi:hypothetical protein